MQSIKIICFVFSISFFSPLVFAVDPLKVGFVYVGPIGDHGWSYQHNQARLEVEKYFGDEIRTTFVEKVQEGADAERVIRNLARRDYDVIFTTSFGFMEPTIRVAKRFKKAKFGHATGYKRTKNISTYNIRFYEGRYIAGLVAGNMTESNVIGYVASFPIPEVIRGINAFTIGLRQVNPDASVRVIWINSWFDPGKEADAAKALMAQGADILLQHTDSPAIMQAAENSGIYAFGQASDMQAFGPNAQLSALINNWTSYYVNFIESVLSGNWKSTDTWTGFSDGSLVMAPWGKSVPAYVREIADKAILQIRAGTLHPFTGEILYQNGDVMLSEGKVMNDDMLLSMNRYVEGVVGSIPK